MTHYHTFKCHIPIIARLNFKEFLWFLFLNIHYFIASHNLVYYNFMQNHSNTIASNR